MSNIDTVKEVYAAYARGDMPGILACLAEDVEWDNCGAGTDVPWLQPRRGHAGVAGFFEAVGLLQVNDFRPKSYFEREQLVIVLVDEDVTVKATGRRVLWVCDPMHGNTEKLGNGVKTRRFANIRSELEQAFDIHSAEGSHLGGVHLELTGEDVTECLGGARNLSEADLGRAYKSTVDPRLNYEQSLELAMLIVRKSGAGMA